MWVTDWKAQRPSLRLYSRWHPCSVALWSQLVSWSFISWLCRTGPSDHTHLTPLLASTCGLNSHCFLAWSPLSLLFSLSDTCALPACGPSIWMIFPCRYCFPGAPTCCSVLQGGHSVSWCLEPASTSRLSRSPFLKPAGSSWGERHWDHLFSLPFSWSISECPFWFRFRWLADPFLRLQSHPRRPVHISWDFLDISINRHCYLLRPNSTKIWSTFLHHLHHSLYNQWHHHFL